MAGFKGFKGEGGALRAMKYIFRLWRQRKLYNLASLDGNAPLLPTAPLHGKASHEIFSRLMAPYKFRSLATPEGEVCSPLPLELT